MKNNFIGDDNWLKSIDFDNKNFIEDKNVLVLRPILFFYSGEKTLLSDIKKHFTDIAINKLVHDNYIKIK